jgi:hypothetical protein
MSFSLLPLPPPSYSLYLSIYLLSSLSLSIYLSISLHPIFFSLTLFPHSLFPSPPSLSPLPVGTHLRSDRQQGGVLPLLPHQTGRPIPHRYLREATSLSPSLLPPDLPALLSPLSHPLPFFPNFLTPSLSLFISFPLSLIFSSLPLLIPLLLPLTLQGVPGRD